MRKSENGEIGKLENRKIGKSENRKISESRQIGKSENRQIGKSENRKIGKSENRKCEKILCKIFAIFEDFINQNMNGFAQIVVLSPRHCSWDFVLGLNPRLRPGP